MQITDAVVLFIEHCRTHKKLSPFTLKAYCADLKIFVPQPASTVSDLTETDLIVQIVRTWILDPDLKPATVKRRVATLKVFIRWLANQKWLPFFPEEPFAFTVKLPKRLPRNLLTSELKKLIGAPARTKDLSVTSGETSATRYSRKDWDRSTARLAIEIMTLTGVRVGELTKITPSDIDHGARSINVLGKGNRERRVFFPDQVTSTRIRRYLSNAERQFGNRPECSLLLNGLGRNASEQYIRRVIRCYAAEMQVERRVTPHMLRHTAATQLLEAGVDIRLVQKLLGHASITTTEIYTHVADYHLHQKITKVNIRKRLERTIDN